LGNGRTSALEFEKQGTDVPRLPDVFAASFSASWFTGLGVRVLAWARCSLASARIRVVASPFSGSFDFVGILRHDFIERGSGVSLSAEDTPQSLFGLTRRRFASEDHSDFDFGQIDALIEDLIRDQCRVPSVSKSLKVVETLSLAAVTEQAGDQKPK
jgi:hypothetical protein